MTDCRCGNTARYITVEGELACGTCPIKTKTDSIRISDVPALLRAARQLIGWIERAPAHGSISLNQRDPFVESLRSLLGKGVSAGGDA